jgi:2-succinyl-5-enolpyruvyl-6-hydroxy-3-cyclohexene-1-carboxylate synthase
MKQSINRNILWAKIFVNRLANLGVKYACISPGSRSTPLTLSFAEEERIKKYVVVDERSSGFFALGLANQTNSPVVLVTTSGTATAELYPAIIEAYQQRIPLIICTADRPPELINTGANQTINQNNIYQNHIFKSFNPGTPDITRETLNHIHSISLRAFEVSINEGPVHINFPFRKPFEPDSYTDEIDSALIEGLLSKANEKLILNKEESGESFTSLAEKLIKVEKGLFIVGPGKYGREFDHQLSQLSTKLGFPVLTDGTSNIRFGKSNFISNSSAFLRSKKFKETYDPSVIIQFGAVPTANTLQKFFAESKADKYLINKHGDWKDPSNTALEVLSYSAETFCYELNNLITKSNSNSEWIDTYAKADLVSENQKVELFNEADVSFESKLVSDIIGLMPEQSNLMLGNSMPVRDVDFFGSSDKNLNIFSNRGASGIDGLNSTAIGIAAGSNNPTALLIGDLAFYHDSNGLHTAYKYEIPLTIALIDNNGGGIFGMLPIAEHKEQFEQYFRTTLNIDFSKIAELYNAEYHEIKNSDELKETFKEAINSKSLNILHIKTDSGKSIRKRKEYWNSVVYEIDKSIKS